MRRHPLFDLRRLTIRAVLLLVALVVASAQAARAETIARCGQGWLETIDGYPVLHLKGTPYEIGYQHGALLKEYDPRELSQHLVNVQGRHAGQDRAGMTAQAAGR